jgi:hypothetical protein
MSWLAPVTGNTKPSSSSSEDLSSARRMHQIVRLKPEYYEAYKKCHAEVWPEVKEQIRRSGIRDCEY